MIILGSDVIIIHMDDARALLKALQGKRTNSDYERLQGFGVLEIVDQFRQAIWEYELKQFTGEEVR